MSLLFNMLSRFVIAFLPRSKHLLIAWLQSPSAVILEPKKIQSVTASTFPPSICMELSVAYFMNLLIAKFRLKLKEVGKTPRPFRCDLNQVPYDYTVEVTIRFKGLDLADRVYEELWMEVCNTVQEAVTKTQFDHINSLFWAWFLFTKEVLVPEVLHLFSTCSAEAFLRYGLAWRPHHEKLVETGRINFQWFIYLSLCRKKKKKTSKKIDSELGG